MLRWTQKGRSWCTGFTCRQSPLQGSDNIRHLIHYIEPPESWSIDEHKRVFHYPKASRQLQWNNGGTRHPCTRINASVASGLMPNLNTCPCNTHSLQVRLSLHTFWAFSSFAGRQQHENENFTLGGTWSSPARATPEGLGYFFQVPRRSKARRNNVDTHTPRVRVLASESNGILTTN